jgi:hypothetical protein
VVTLPQNIIGDLDISPPLGDGKLAASREKTASRGVKAWIRVRGPIDPFFAYSSATHPLSVVRTEYLGDDDAVLVAFGADAARLDPNAWTPFVARSPCGGTTSRSSRSPGTTG